MIQNENLVYNDEKCIFNIETYARAPACAKKKVNSSFPEKHPFSVIFKGDKGMDIFFNFRPMIMIQNENTLYND